MKVDINQESIDTIFSRGVVAEVTPSLEEFKDKLSSGMKLRFYLGIDVTAESIHLGHAGNLLLLEDFRSLGHEVIVLLGDFTAKIGDPTGKEKSRTELGSQDIEKNISTLSKQINLVVKTSGENPATIRQNSEWLSKLSFSEIISLARNFTVQQMIERDMFKKRLKENAPIFLHEFLYPLLQGYDSVALETDVEVGGTDQLFNMMAGRTLLERLKGKEKFVLTTNLLSNPNTGVLMSKSAGTGVFLSETPKNLFGALMSQEDEMMRPLLIHATRLPVDEIDKLVESLKDGGERARDAKLEISEKIVSTFHSEDDARNARDEFVSTFTNKDLTSIPEIKLPYKKEKLFIALVDAKLSQSNTEAKRLIEDGAVEVNGEVVKDPFTEINVSGTSIRVGKHRFARLIA